MEEEKGKLSYVTFIIVIFNIIAFIIYTILGEIVYNNGSLSVVDIIERQEYYRILSCAFLHAGINHILSNMLFLIILGDMMEKEIGHMAFAIIYLISAVGGSLFSMLYELVTGHYYHTVGASGAVCGLIGAMLIIVVLHHGNFKEVSLPRIILAICFLIYSGMKSEYVNNAAHIGGLFAGVISMICVNKVKGLRVRKN